MNVVNKHLKNDPKVRRTRRKLRLSMFSSLLGSLVVLGVFLLLLKSFIFALNGPRDYAELIAPLLQGQSEDAILVTLLSIDPVSAQIAEMMAPLFSGATDVAASSAEIVRP